LILAQAASPEAQLPENLCGALFVDLDHAGETALRPFLDATVEGARLFHFEFGIAILAKAEVGTEAFHWHRARSAHSRRREVRQFQAMSSAAPQLARQIFRRYPKQRTEAEHNQQDGDRDERHRIDNGANMGFQGIAKASLCAASAVSNSLAMNSMTVTLARSPRSSHQCRLPR
jgi:hypothetical protein